MNERLITDLLTAYRHAPTSNKLESMRLVLADALEEFGDWRADEVRKIKVYRPDFPKGFLTREDRSFWVDAPFYSGSFMTSRGAEKAIRAHLLELFTLVGALRRYALAEPEQLHSIRLGLVAELERHGDKRAAKLARWQVVQEEVEYWSKEDQEEYARIRTIKSLIKTTGRKMAWMVKTNKGSYLHRRHGFDTVEAAEAAIRDYSKSLFLEMWPDDEFKRQVMADRKRHDEWLAEATHQHEAALQDA